METSAAANYRLMLTVLLVMIYSQFTVISGAAGVVRRFPRHGATLIDDEDMAAELINGDLHFEITVSIDLMCEDDWFNDVARRNFMKVIREGLFAYINSKCNCGFNRTDLTNEQLLCDNHLYHYSAQLVTSLDVHHHYLPSQVLEDISEWPEKKPKIPVDTTLYGGSDDILSFIVENTQVSYSSGDGSGDVPKVSEPVTSGDENVEIITPGDEDNGGDPTEDPIVVVDKQEEGDDGSSGGQRNGMSVIVVIGALLTIVSSLAL